MNVRNIGLTTLIQSIVIIGCGDVSGRNKCSSAPRNSQSLVERKGKKVVGMRSGMCGLGELKRGTVYAALSDMTVTVFIPHRILRNTLGKRGGAVYPTLHRTKDAGLVSSHTSRTGGMIELLVDLYRRVHRAVQITILGSSHSIFKVGG